MTKKLKFENLFWGVKEM